MKCEKCIHYGVCMVNSYCHERCGYYEETRPHGEWIPCSERLPEDDETVIVCSDNGKIETASGFYYGEDDDLKWDWCTSSWTFGKVIAWMPLPEPYKRGEAE